MKNLIILISGISIVAAILGWGYFQYRIEARLQLQSQIAEAQARIAEAQAAIIETQEEAQTERLEMVLIFLSIPLIIILTVGVLGFGIWITVWIISRSIPAISEFANAYQQMKSDQ